MQQDWYLHEQRTPAPAIVITPVGGSLGANLDLCVSGTYTLTVGSNFAGVQAGDYLLMRVYFGNETAKFGTESRWLSLPVQLIYVDWHPTFAPSVGSEGNVPPNTNWVGGFISSANETFTFLSRGSNPTGFQNKYCFQAWVLRGVSKTHPVDCVYYADNYWLGSFGTNVPVSSLSNTATGNIQNALAHWTGSPPIGKENTVQIAEHAIVGTSTGTYSFFGSWTGPTEAYDFSKRFVFISGASTRYEYLASFVDVISAGAFSEITQTDWPDSVSGGMRTWSRTGSAASATWIGTLNSNAAYLRGFQSSNVSVTAIQQYSKKAVLTPGQEYAYWAHIGATDSGGSQYAALSVVDPNGVEFGVSVVYGQFTPDMYKPFNGGFKKYGVHRTDQGGIPSRVAQVNLGVFEASITGTYQFNVFVTSNGEDTGKSNLGIGIFYIAAAGVNPTNKSVGLPYFNPLLGIPYGIQRIALGDNTDTQNGSGWDSAVSPLAKSRYFGVNPENSGIIPFYFVAASSRYMNIGPSLVRQSTSYRHNAWDDENAEVETNRCIWPRRYETSSTVTWTWGHYYWEVEISDISTTSALQYGIKSPSNQMRLQFANNGANALSNLSRGSFTLSAGLMRTISGYCIVGLEMDYAPPNPKLRVSRDGSVMATFKITDQTLSGTFVAYYYPLQQPLKFYVTSGSQTTSRTTFKGNFTGPFSYKPAGAVALDWENEVP